MFCFFMFFTMNFEYKIEHISWTKCRTALKISVIRFRTFRIFWNNFCFTIFQTILWIVSNIPVACSAWAGYSNPYTEKIFSESCLSLPNMDCNYTFTIYLVQNLWENCDNNLNLVRLSKIQRIHISQINIH